MQPERVAALRAVSITKSFVEGAVRRDVLRGADLLLERGRFGALLGRSGAGKSTLLNVLSGIDVPDAGRVEIDGIELSALGEEDRTAFRRRHLGFVFQAFNLIPTLSVVENVALPLTLNGSATAHAIRRAGELLDRVGLADRRSAYPDRLSGGEQQRVAIVRALAHEPTLLLADEPTGNLDWETGRSVMDLLHGLVREFGVTMLVVTHDHDLLAASDAVWRLRGGILEPVPEGRA